MMKKDKNIILPIKKEKSVTQRAKFPYITVNMLNKDNRLLSHVFNPAEQRRATEAAERAAQQARAEAERIEDEQRGSEQNNRRRSQGHEV